MNMNIQSSDYVLKVIKARIKINQDRGSKSISIASIFRELRKNEDVSFWGDCVLLGIIVDEVSKYYPIRNSTLIKLLSKMDGSGLELRTRKSILTQLLNSPPRIKNNKPSLLKRTIPART